MLGWRGGRALLEAMASVTLRAPYHIATGLAPYRDSDKVLGSVSESLNFIRDLMRNESRLRLNSLIWELSQLCWNVFISEQSQMMCLFGYLFSVTAALDQIFACRASQVVQQ